jgi:poly-gamma-glutamate synthesis protein (capsule biosynthesis protein)
VPDGIVARVVPTLTQEGYAQQPAPEEAAVQIVLNPGPEVALTAQWIYIVVAPFPTIPDGVSWAGFTGYWQRGDASGLVGFDPAPRLALTADAADLLIGLIGPSAAGLPLDLYGADQAGQLVDLAWAARPSISVVPFEQLEPRWKTLAVDGRSPLDESFDPATYPLTVQVGLIASGDEGAQAAALLQGSGAWPATNRDPARLVAVVMTGVTALSRATAMQMELQGTDFPARQILPFLADADILHISNEASFAVDCPEPDWYGEPRFCSQPDYLALLESIGTDIVELTGNHNNDWGISATSYTLDLYDERGLRYYGGGRNLDDASAPRILTAPDGTRLAFVGCNSAGPYTAWATPDSPGAAPCEDWARIRQQIADLKASDQADIVISTVQYQELDSYRPNDQQRADFEALALAGADLVSGSQAHQPQGFAFVDGSFVHFGVGNLFFDQIEYVENRQMFIDRHVFYEGRHISTVLFTGWFEEVGQARSMTPEERTALLQTIFAASGW